MKKTFRVLSALLIAVSLFALSAQAAVFSPSIERNPGPVLVDEDSSVLLVTPLWHLYREEIDLHIDIENSLKTAEEQMKKDTWLDEIPGFAEAWKKATYGAPVDHAVITDVFDVRYCTELSQPKLRFRSALPSVSTAEGQDLTFKIMIQGLTADDVFLLVGKTSEAEGWKIVDYVMRSDDVIIIESKTMSAFAILRDTGAEPAVTPGAPDSPHTGVSPYLFPAIIGAVLFSAGAVLCVIKLRRRTAA